MVFVDWVWCFLCTWFTHFFCSQVVWLWVFPFFSGMQTCVLKLLIVWSVKFLDQADLSVRSTARPVYSRGDLVLEQMESIPASSTKPLSDHFRPRRHIEPKGAIWSQWLAGWCFHTYFLSSFPFWERRQSPPSWRNIFVWNDHQRRFGIRRDVHQWYLLRRYDRLLAEQEVLYKAAWGEWFLRVKMCFGWRYCALEPMSFAQTCAFVFFATPLVLQKTHFLTACIFAAPIPPGTCCFWAPNPKSMVWTTFFKVIFHLTPKGPQRHGFWWVLCTSKRHQAPGGGGPVALH